jgi:hypothetical protein
MSWTLKERDRKREGEKGRYAEARKEGRNEERG